MTPVYCLGMCGSADSDRTNDYTGSDGKVYPGTRMPAEWIKTWRYVAVLVLMVLMKAP